MVSDYNSCNIYGYDQFRNWEVRMSGSDAVEIADRVYKSPVRRNA